MHKFFLRLVLILLSFGLGTAVLAQAVDIIDISEGSIQSVFVDKNGTVWTWGRSRLSPEVTELLPTRAMENGQSVFANLESNTSFVIKKDGSLWGWGASVNGELGVFFSGCLDVQKPRRLLAKVVSVAGHRTVFVLKPDGSLWTWGSFGKQRGDRVTKDTTRPRKVMDHVVQVSASASHTLALDKNGILWSWGYNPCGALGTGDTKDHVKPVKVNLKPLGQRKVVKIATRYTESFLLADDGTVWSWGEPNVFRPYCIAPPRWVPTQIDTIDQVSDMAIGRLFKIYLKKDGSVWLSSYVLHPDNFLKTCQKNPCKITDDVVEIAAGQWHFLVLKKDGTVWGWGANEFGQLGDGTTETRREPVQVRFDLKPEELPPEPVKKAAPGTCAPLPTR